jgi:hypothetical protein
MDRRRAKETGRPPKGWKDRRRDSDRPSADTPFHLFAVTAPLQKTTEAIRRLVGLGAKGEGEMTNGPDATSRQISLFDPSRRDSDRGLVAPYSPRRRRIQPEADLGGRSGCPCHLGDRCRRFLQMETIAIMVPLNA